MLKTIAAMRPAWLEIDLDNLHANFDAVYHQGSRYFRGCFTNISAYCRNICWHRIVLPPAK